VPAGRRSQGSGNRRPDGVFKGCLI
jgi:hypothetical protein